MTPITSLTPSGPYKLGMPIKMTPIELVTGANEVKNDRDRKTGSPITSQMIDDLIGDPFFLDRSQPCESVSMLQFAATV